MILTSHGCLKKWHFLWEGVLVLTDPSLFPLWFFLIAPKYLGLTCTGEDAGEGNGKNNGRDLSVCPLHSLFSNHQKKIYTFHCSVWLNPKSERNRIRNFFRYQIFTIPNSILFSIPIFFWYRYRYHQNNWKSFETEKFQNVTHWY